MSIVNVRNLNGPFTGVQRYTHEIVKRLPNIKTIGENAPQGFRGHLWEQVYLGTFLPSELLWSPGNTGPIIRRNQVITIHDLSSIDHPEWFSKSFSSLYNFVLPKVARSSRHIITVSNFSKNRIVERLKIDGDKVSVTPLGVDGKFRKYIENDESIISRFGIKRKEYFLIVASLEPRKNIKAIISAWKNWKYRPEDMKLVIVGGSSSIFKSENLEDREDTIYLGRVNDEVLIALYACARAFIYIPIYEGFGLPPLEAMASGIPVIASKIPPIVEVVGKSALLVDPNSEEELLSAMEQLLDNTLLERMSNSSIERSKIFSWDKTSDATRNILEGFDD